MLRSRIIYLLLAVLTLLALVPGIWEPTGLSGKDEYFLGLRTPMEMMTRQEWLVPFLDGAPRIRKPPLLYWLGRGSYELFGISLSSARLVTILFSALLVMATAGIARRLLPRPDQAWLAAGVLLSCLGLHTEGRRFMLDIPVVALATTAFWLWLIWREKGKTGWLTLSTLCLAAGFMVKGPVVFLVYLGGIVATMRHEHQRRLAAPPLKSSAFILLILLHLALLAALCAPWFMVVRQLYPEAVEAVVADEVGSRQFMTLTPGIIFGLLNISLPWFFVFWAAVVRRKNLAPIAKPLIFWFLITFVPFLFLKSFDRYLLGSLVPLALLLALLLDTPSQRPVWAFRAGLSVALLLGVGLSSFSAWFGLSGWWWLLLPMVYLIWAWVLPNRRAVVHLLAAPATYWVALLWGVFPGLGVGHIPADIVADAKTHSVAFYDGPQPAMLPILSAQAHRHYAQLSLDDFTHLGNTPIFAEEAAFQRLFNQANAAGITLKESRCFLTLASHGSGIRFIKPGATRADWQEAFVRHDLSPLQTRICTFQRVATGGKP